MSRDIFHYTRLLRAPSSLALNTSREGASTASLGNLFQCFTTIMVKNFFLISSLNLPSFSLEPIEEVTGKAAQHYEVVHTCAGSEKGHAVCGAMDMP